MSNVLKYKGFTASVNFSAEDKAFIGKLELTNDLVTFEGTTVPELEKSFKDAVNEYLELCKEAGKEPEKPFKGTFNVRVKPELHKKAATLAIETNTSLNHVVAEALTQYIQAGKQKS